MLKVNGYYRKLSAWIIAFNLSVDFILNMVCFEENFLQMELCHNENACSFIEKKKRNLGSYFLGDCTVFFACVIRYQVYIILPGFPVQVCSFPYY